MSRGDCGDLLKFQWPVQPTNKHKCCCLKVVRCGYVESHETDVPFTHLPEFHISDHKEFLKSNLTCVKVLHFTKSR